MAHTTALMASYTRVSHSHAPSARTPTSHMSSTAPSTHSPAQNGQGLPLGGPGSLWLATALGSSAAVSRSRHDSTPTASFEAFSETTKLPYWSPIDRITVRKSTRTIVQQETV